MQKSDEVLRYILSFRERCTIYGNIENYFVYEKRFKDEDFTVIILEQILKNLEKSGYIYQDLVVDKNTTRHILWHLSATGEMFILEDGYEGILKRNLQEKSRIEKNDKRLSYGTVLLAIGTFLLVLVEAYRTYLEFFSCN